MRAPDLYKVTLSMTWLILKSYRPQPPHIYVILRPTKVFKDLLKDLEFQIFKVFSVDFEEYLLDKEKTPFNLEIF